jgi:hypothetical protein
MPLAMLSPCVSMAFFCASTLKASELLGDEAAIHCSTAKRRRALVFSSASMASAMFSIVRPLSRYTAAEKADSGLLPQASPAKRLSPSGLALKPWPHSAVASARYCCWIDWSLSGAMENLGSPGIFMPPGKSGIRGICGSCHSGVPPGSKAEAPCAADCWNDASALLHPSESACWKGANASAPVGCFIMSPGPRLNRYGWLACFEYPAFTGPLQRIPRRPAPFHAPSLTN